MFLVSSHIGTHRDISSWLGFANEDLRALTTSGAGSLVADEADS